MLAVAFSVLVQTVSHPRATLDCQADAAPGTRQQQGELASGVAALARAPNLEELRAGTLVLEAADMPAPLRVAVDSQGSGCGECTARKTGGVSIDLPAWDCGPEVRRRH